LEKFQGSISIGFRGLLVEWTIGEKIGFNS
jgi:hypothetical protein